MWGQEITNPQQKIDLAFGQTFVKKSPEPLTQFLKKWDAKRDKIAEREFIYWQSYANYYLSIYWYKTGVTDFIDDAEDLIIETVDRMNQLENKTVEDYALLAKIEPFRFAFDGIQGMKAAYLGYRINENLQQGLALDSNNLRLNLVLAQYDFSTPEVFGGGKKCERHFIKALELFNQKTDNPLMPTWGKSEAYVGLIKYYLKNNQKEKAVSYYQKAIKEFPKNYELINLAEKLI